MFGWAVIKHVSSVISAEPVAWLSADALPTSYPDPVCEMCGAVLDGSGLPLRRDRRGGIKLTLKKRTRDMAIIELPKNQSLHHQGRCRLP